MPGVWGWSWQTGLGCFCSDLKVFLTFLITLNAGTTPGLALSPRETSGLFRGWKTCTGKSSYLHKTYTAEDEAADITITLPLQASSMAVQPGHSWVGPIRRLPPLSMLCRCLEIHHQLTSHSETTNHKSRSCICYRGFNLWQGRWMQMKHTRLRPLSCSQCPPCLDSIGPAKMS